MGFKILLLCFIIALSCCFIAGCDKTEEPVTEPTQKPVETPVEPSEPTIPTDDIELGETLESNAYVIVFDEYVVYDLEAQVDSEGVNLENQQDILAVSATIINNSGHKLNLNEVFNFYPYTGDFSYDMLNTLNNVEIKSDESASGWICFKGEFPLSEDWEYNGVVTIKDYSFNVIINHKGE